MKINRFVLNTVTRAAPLFLQNKGVLNYVSLSVLNIKTILILTGR